MNGAGYLPQWSESFCLWKSPASSRSLFEFLGLLERVYHFNDDAYRSERRSHAAGGLLELMKAQNAKAEYGQMYAGMVMVMVPTLILYMCVQKKLTQGHDHRRHKGLRRIAVN